MVNEKQLRKALPKLFTEGDPRYSNRHSEYEVKKRKLRRIERKHPSSFQGLMKKAARTLNEIEKALQEDFEF